MLVQIWALLLRSSREVGLLQRFANLSSKSVASNVKRGIVQAAAG